MSEHRTAERQNIRAAIDRLLAGTPLRSDGALTVVSLAAEADVKRHLLTHRHTDLKALVHEQFGDGIISAINFKLDVNKVADPEAGERAVITIDGKYLPNKLF